MNLPRPAHLALCVVALGCGGRASVDSSPVAAAAGGAGGAGGGSAGGAGTAGQPLPPPGQPPLPSPSAVDASAFPPAVYAIRRWRLGDVDANGQPTPDGCKAIGFNLDGQSFPKPKAKQQCGAGVADGPSGVDNVLGCGIFGYSDPPASGTMSALATSGTATVLIGLDHVGADGSFAPASGFVASAVGLSSPTGQPIVPSEQDWADGTYAWRPLSGKMHFLACGFDASVWATRSALPGGYVVDDTWVAGAFGPFAFVLPFDEHGDAGPMRWFPVVFRHGWVSARLSPDRRRLEGTLGGMIAYTDLDAAVYATAGCSGLCPTTYVGWTDLVVDGPNPDVACNAASFGIAFDAELTTVGAPIDAVTQTNICSADAP